MLLIEIRTNGWKTHGGYSGSQEPEEDGCWWPLGSLC